MISERGHKVDFRSDTALVRRKVAVVGASVMRGYLVSPLSKAGYGSKAVSGGPASRGVFDDA
jgi:hypothetical protein